MRLFLSIRGPFLGALIASVIVYWSLYWGSLFAELECTEMQGMKLGGLGQTGHCHQQQLRFQEKDCKKNKKVEVWGAGLRTAGLCRSSELQFSIYAILGRLLGASGYKVG